MKPRIGGRRSPSSIERGYEDAYRQFIEPVVGASGEQLARATSARASRCRRDQSPLTWAYD